MSTPTTYTTQFTQKIGDTEELIHATFEYCQDFTGDGFKDVKVTLSLDSPLDLNSTNSGTEDLIGVAFDIRNDAVAGLTVSNITTATFPNTPPLSTFDPTFVIGANQVSDGGPLDPGFSTSGGSLGENGEPYDVGIKFSDQGSGEGIVQSASFVLSISGADIDAEALLDTTDWWVRLQSTDGGEGSAKMALFDLDLPPCVEEPPPGENGYAKTPGFWKQDQHFQYWQDYAPTDSFTGTFGVNVSVPFTDTLLGALNAERSRTATAYDNSVRQLGRAGTAALLNAASDEAGTGINYITSDDDALQIGYAQSGVSLPFSEIQVILGLIDTNSDSRISTAEVITSVGSAINGGNRATISNLAQAFDTMNNMPGWEF